MGSGSTVWKRKQSARSTFVNTTEPMMTRIMTSIYTRGISTLTLNCASLYIICQGLMTCWLWYSSRCTHVDAHWLWMFKLSTLIVPFWRIYLYVFTKLIVNHLSCFISLMLFFTLCIWSKHVLRKFYVCLLNINSVSFFKAMTFNMQFYSTQHMECCYSCYWINTIKNINIFL